MIPLKNLYKNSVRHFVIFIIKKQDYLNGFENYKASVKENLKICFYLDSAILNKAVFISQINQRKYMELSL